VRASGRDPRRTALLLSALFAAALLLRLAPFAAATEGGLRLLSPDCYGHLRRATSVARNFPHVPVFDPWLNHPDGAVFIWPPLFDLLVGGSARLLFGASVAQDQVAWVAASLPPLLGALHVVPLYFLCRRLFGRRRAALAAAAYALLPAAAIWSCFGHGDHHVLEVLVLLLFLDAAAAAARARPERRARPALLAGALLALSVLTWQGAVVFAALAFPWSLLLLGPAAPLLGAAAAALSAAGTAAALGGEKVPFAFISFGWFQPLLLAAGTIPLAAWAAYRSRGRARIAWGAAALVLLLAAAPFAPPLAAAIGRGSAHVASLDAALGDDFDGRGYLSYPASLLSVIAEIKPLLGAPSAPNALRAVEELSAGLVLLPAALLLWAAPLVGSRARRLRARSLVVLFGAALLLMTLSQRRNVYYLGVFASIALAEGIARVAGRARVRREGGLLAAAACLVVLPGLAPLRTMAAYREAPGTDFVGLLRRFGASAPTGIDPAALPAPAPGAIEGLFAPWATGHFVTALTGRPAAADPNGYGWLRQCRLYTATDEAEPLAILRQARCGWLMTANLRGVLASYAAAAGREAGTPVGEMFAVRVHESASRRPVPFLELAMESRTGYRTGGRIVPAFRIWRVIDPAAPEGASAPSPAGPGAARGR
jgi:asparagine N-glycosylation enzyme membrane subunit Stt3